MGSKCGAGVNPRAGCKLACGGRLAIGSRLTTRTTTESCGSRWSDACAGSRSHEPTCALVYSPAARSHRKDLLCGEIQEVTRIGGIVAGIHRVRVIVDPRVQSEIV